VDAYLQKVLQRAIHNSELDFNLCLSNSVIFYKMATGWLYMYKGIDKVLSIHTLALDGIRGVLQSEQY
jgi:hypothetical protein